MLLKVVIEMLHQMTEEANLFLIVLNYYIMSFKESTLEGQNHT